MVPIDFFVVNNLVILRPSLSCMKVAMMTLHRVSAPALVLTRTDDAASA
jgi:hypothetical protein